MQIGVISDTHSNLDNASRAAEILREHQVEAVIHCGDIGSPIIVHEFTEWPTHFVFGNVDHDEALLRHAIRDAGLTCHDRFGEIELQGRKIAFLHSDNRTKFDKTIASGKYDLVCYGHTHHAESHMEGNTLVLNPGALHRANPHQLAIVDLETMSVQHHVLYPEE
ncbi:YfcE family phosphodiesterase [Thalassoglobus sp.]|uniref:YfcE family phosphodiesterase n=1 Tax=Thalassoglobus sp. TaxID=2795869 RepID=UPI003AA8DCC8